MTLDRVKNGVYFECDEPHCIEVVEGINFEELKEIARDEGWISLQKHGEWFHYCAEHHPKPVRLDISKLLGKTNGH